MNKFPRFPGFGHPAPGTACFPDERGIPMPGSVGTPIR